MVAVVVVVLSRALFVFCIFYCVIVYIQHYNLIVLSCIMLSVYLAVHV